MRVSISIRVWVRVRARVGVRVKVRVTIIARLDMQVYLCRVEVWVRFS